ncbi:hypothetical protein M0R45_007930 [Rubus argutus]|uniref:TF-B3 domain-containing protein n=1 Tax=Rubus argutus TaxID=59490 RepID=A0AAW1Y2N2_RUBAR
MMRRASTSHNGGVEEEKKEPTFFKIIKPGFNTEHLRIPPAFRKHVVHELTKRATLKLKNSSNCSWTVKVNTTGRDVYLKDGWQKFLRDNSLGDSEFLQFRYVRNMNFIISIFDKNCVERVNIADIRTHEASTFPDNTRRRLGRPPIGNRRYDSAEEAAKVLKCKGGNLPSSAAAASFKSKFPYFVKVLKGWQKVAVPTHFYMEILSSSSTCDELILVTSEGKFTVKLVQCSDTVMLSAGWSSFRDVNQLQVNDICIFELVKENTMVVHIFPN